MTHAHTDLQSYEAPAIVVLGPVEELTLGSGGDAGGDANATYEGAPVPF